MELILRAKSEILLPVKIKEAPLVVGVGHDATLSEVHRFILSALTSYVAVLTDPPPRVIVEELSSATVSIRVYYWIAIHEHDALPARSSGIRVVKAAVEEAGISLLDEAREVVFPEGVPLQRVSGQQLMRTEAEKPTRAERSIEATPEEPQEDLTSDRGDIVRQLQNSTSPEMAKICCNQRRKILGIEGSFFRINSANEHLARLGAIHGANNAIPFHGFNDACSPVVPDTKGTLDH